MNRGVREENIHECQVHSGVCCLKDDNDDDDVYELKLIINIFQILADKFTILTFALIWSIIDI